jgi:succinate dehydrogenase flavin-adding protein (antitoxin of CptAB toxin-antitoxin module)
MGSEASLRQQHSELLQLVDEVKPLLAAERLAHGCTAVRLMVSAFVRKLNVHLVLEERFVYERLLHHPDEAVVATTMRHREQTGRMRDVLTHYAERWELTMDQAIENASASFAQETTDLFEMVSKRFESENEELYPLLEQLRIASGTWPRDSTPRIKTNVGTS